MKTSLTINATRAGKKVAKSFGYVNPDVANSLVGGFAQMVNALSNDTFVNAEVVKKMDTTEEDSGGGSAPATAKQEGIITLSKNDFYGPKSITYSYNGDATVKMIKTEGYGSATLEGDTITVNESYGFYLLYADATDNFTAAVTILRVYERDD